MVNTYKILNHYCPLHCLLYFCKLFLLMLIPSLLLLQGHNNPLVHICMSRLVTEETGTVGQFRPVTLLVQLLYMHLSCRRNGTIGRKVVLIAGNLQALLPVCGNVCVCGSSHRGRGFVLLPFCEEKKKSVYPAAFLYN